jgi:cytochrome P450
VVLCRQLEDDVVVGGYLVPKGSIAVLCHHTMSNSEEYVANPRAFCPERWIKSSPQYVSSHGRINYKDTEPYMSAFFL